MAGEIRLRGGNRRAETLKVTHDRAAAWLSERWRLKQGQKEEAQRLVDVEARIAPLATSDIQLPVHARNGRSDQTVIDLLGHRPRLRIDGLVARTEFNQFLST